MAARAGHGSKCSVQLLNTRGVEPSIVTAVSEPKTNTRFTIPVTSPERKKAAKGVIPTNTEASSTRWAIKKFQHLGLSIAQLSTRSRDDFVPPDLLKSHDAALVCKWLCRYVMETRREDRSTTAEQQLSECSPKVELEAPTVSSESKPITTAPASANPFVHTLSGTFSNCTINISMK